jgi:hypothetical protein
MENSGSENRKNREGELTMRPTEVNFRTEYGSPIVHMIFDFENGTGASVLIEKHIVTHIMETTITNTPNGWWESTYRERSTEFEVCPILFNYPKGKCIVNDRLCNNKGYPRKADNRAEMMKILEKLRKMKV